MISTIKHAYRKYQHDNRDAKVESKRSAHWPAVEHAWLETHPVCDACGSTHNLNVHHVIPFASDPSKELDISNLITLCMSKDRHCHLLLGHGGLFRAYSLTIISDARAARIAVQENNEVAFTRIVAKAKENRKNI